MKRNYVKPELEVVMFDLESQILTNSPGNQGEINPDGPGGDALTNKRNPQGGWNSNNWE